MERYSLRKAALNAWIEAMLDHRQVLAPSRIEQEIFFRSVETAPEQDLLEGTAVLPYLPPKDIVFPQSEVMFSFSGEGEELSLEVPGGSETYSVILGLRPCDTRGIFWLDHFFQENVGDFYYSRRRDKVALVTIACNQPVKNCFCICCQGGPFLEPESEECDIQLISFQDRYLVGCQSARGKELINMRPELFSCPEAGSEEIWTNLEEESRKMFFPDPTSYMSAAIRRITSNEVPSEVWTELGDRCFDDGGCSFVCPCCSCFGVGYLANGEKGCHYRYWDSCDYSGFTREVSGHNPRMDKGERFKRRFFHKLSYQYLKKDGRIGCVGCGRCITVCPGGIGMPLVVERIRKAQAAEDFK